MPPGAAVSSLTSRLARLVRREANGRGHFKDQIERRLTEHVSEPKIWAKYAWLARYHNWFAQGLRQWRGFHDLVLMREALVSVGPRRLVPRPGPS